MLKNRTLLSFFTLLVFTICSFGQKAEKTLVKSFNLQGQQEVLVSFDGNLSVETWQNDYLRIQMKITLENEDAKTLRSLILGRRYDLRSKVENNQLVIFAPGLEREVRLPNTYVDESIEILLFAPNSVVVRQVSADAHASVDKSSL